jgi:hypothetical protein
MSRETLEITCNDVANALNLFEKLEYGQGKAAAATVVNATVRLYINAKLKPLAESRGPLTPEEIAACRRGEKLTAIKLFRQRKGNQYDDQGMVVKRGLSLLDCKLFVEKHGAKYLAESGRYNENGTVRL